MLFLSTVAAPCSKTGLAFESPMSIPTTDEPQMMKAATSATALTRSAWLHRFQSDCTSRIGCLSRLGSALLQPHAPKYRVTSN